MRKLIIAAIALAVAGPVFAQSFDPSIGSGNLAPTIMRTAPGAESAFAQVVTPAPKKAHPVKQKAGTTKQTTGVAAPTNPNSPAACGGGSAGYNEKCSQ